VLLHEYLVKYYGTVEGTAKNSGFESFEHDSKLGAEEILNKISLARDGLHLTRVKELGDKRKNCEEAHKKTKDFHSKLTAYDGTQKSCDEITDMILEINKDSIKHSTSVYHLYFCLDESGSMDGAPWNSLLDAVGAFCKNRIELCQKNGAPVEDLVTVVNYGSIGRIVFEKAPIVSVDPHKSIICRWRNKFFCRIAKDQRSSSQKG
jgi:hypothetical protein